MSSHIKLGALNAVPQPEGISLDGGLGDIKELKDFFDVVMFLIEDFFKVILQVLVHFEHFNFLKVQSLLDVKSTTYLI